MNKNPKIQEIKKFWDERAEKYGEDWQATLGEKYLRLLEIKTVLKIIRRLKPGNVLDVGCGNGYSTKKYADHFTDIKFTGLDYSEEMIALAQKRPLPNCRFMVADVLRPETFPDDTFDLILTQRCLQNLPDYESQHEAIHDFLKRRSPKGTLCLMECSRNGVEQLNNLRVKLGMAPIEGIEPWHNNFFYDQKLIDDFNARLVHFSSTYMFLSKVVSPVFSHLGYLLPSLGKFGYDKIYLIQ